jgi:hypothetical protein
MTPQGMLRARFSELAESLGVTLSVRRQTGKFYFTVTGTLEDTNKFMDSTFPGAWMTSAAGPECVYGLPVADVERVLAEVQIEPALQHDDATPVQIARYIREEGAFDRLPILADALEEGGCSSAEILNHCRGSAPHQQTCWVVELLLGPDRKHRRARRPDSEATGEMGGSSG